MPSFELHSFALTDIGKRRQVNQDAFLRDDETGVWIVADGMGGHKAGEVASREAIDAAFAMVKRQKAEMLQRLDRGEAFDDNTAWEASRMLEGAIQSATYMVFGLAELDSEKAGMGTTISAMVALGDHVITGQVGDSRIYRVRQGTVTQLTEDHTLINWQLKQGLITAEEAQRSKNRNVITRAVGNREYVQVDTNVLELEPGDQYLLCSDGLHGYLRVDEIPTIAAVGGNLAVKRFVDLANARGGRDNITAVLVEVH